MKNKYTPVLLLLFSAIFMWAEKLAEFQDNFKVPYILIDNNQIYIWDKFLRKICIYSRRGFDKIAEFGRQGQGPGEFIGIHKVILSNDSVLVNSFPKLCFFSKKGKLQKELKSPTNAGSYIPLGSNFVGISYPHTNHTDKNVKILFSLFNSSLEKKKDIFLTKSRVFVTYGKSKATVYWVNDCTKAFVYDEKLYIGSTDKGYFIIVFDLNGNTLYEIKRIYKKRKVTDEYKKYRTDNFKNSLSEMEWKQYKERYDVAFPDYFPAYASFFVDDGKIYVFDYPGIKKNDIQILDLKGNLLKNKNIPIENVSSSIIGDRYSIRSGKFYYLEENENTENWELHVINIGG
jgi:hypothetical protein